MRSNPLTGRTTCQGQPSGWLEVADDDEAVGGLSPVPRNQPQPPTRKPPLVCDPNPRDTVRDREWAEEHKQPLSVSHAKDDHREAGANANRGNQGGHEAVGNGEVREMALQRPGLRPDAPGRTGPLRMEQSTRQLHAARRFRFDDDETDVIFLFPRPVFAFQGHGLLNTISQDFPRGNPVTAYTDHPQPGAPSPPDFLFLDLCPWGTRKASTLGGGRCPESKEGPSVCFSWWPQY